MGSPLEERKALVGNRGTHPGCRSSRLVPVGVTSQVGASRRFFRPSSGEKLKLFQFFGISRLERSRGLAN